ncbi:MAG: tetratricopeptide repeat protein, partial [Phycisphaerales bacterium]
MSEWFDAEEHVERAHEHYEAGRWAEAESELRHAISMHPDRADWHFNLGLTLDAAGKHDAAMEAFRDAHDLDPKESSPMLAMGAICLRIDKIHDAVRWFEAAAKAKPDRQDAYVHLIDAYGRLSRHDDAETAFYQALHCEGRDESSHGEHDAMAYANLAESLADRGSLDRAVWCLREALRLDPDLPRASARLADLYAETGKHERARQLYLRELRASPGDIDTLLGLGRLLVSMKRLGEASEKFRRVLEIESDHPDAHFELAALAEREGRDKEAIAGYRLVLRLDPDYPSARRRLATRLRENGEHDAAAALLLRELREAQRNLEAFEDGELDELGDLLVSTGRFDEAAVVYRWYANRRASDAEAQHRLGAALLLSGNVNQGAKAERRALTLSRGRHLKALQNLALVAIERGQWKRARAFSRAATAIDSDDAGSRRLRARLRLHTLAFVASFAWNGSRWLWRHAWRT